MEPVTSLATRKRPGHLRAVEGGGTPGPSDEALMAGIRDGDQTLAAILYDRLFPVVDHTVFRVFGRRESDHDDLIQTAFEQIVITLSRRSFARACSLRTWASTVTSHVALNALRSRRRERRVFDRTVDPRIETGTAAGDPEREVATRSAIDLVRRELAAMRPERAETVFLHDVLGHDLAEIALTTGVSVAAAQSRLVRGRKELHERLGKANARGEP